jgi:hypothetical protein
MGRTLIPNMDSHPYSSPPPLADPARAGCAQAGQVRRLFRELSKNILQNRNNYLIKCSKNIQYMLNRKILLEMEHIKYGMK